jgi:hypothetical protein
MKMKSPQKITRVQLDPGPGKDFFLFGIVSTEPDYRLSLSINKTLKISLKNDKPLDLKNGRTISASFSRFTDHSAKNDLSWNLISNKTGEAILITKLKNIDYLFQVIPADHHFNDSGISINLKKIETITAVFTLNPDEIKDKNLHYLIP